MSQTPEFGTLCGTALRSGKALPDIWACLCPSLYEFGAKHFGLSYINNK
jgi:hypothetical protein